MIKKVRKLLGVLFTTIGILILWISFLNASGVGIVVALLGESLVIPTAWLLFLGDEHYDRSAVQNFASIIGTICIIVGIIFVILSFGLLSAVLGPVPEYWPVTVVSGLLSIMLICAFLVINKRVDQGA